MKYVKTYEEFELNEGLLDISKENFDELVIKGDKIITTDPYFKRLLQQYEEMKKIEVEKQFRKGIEKVTKADCFAVYVSKNFNIDTHKFFDNVGPQFSWDEKNKKFIQGGKITASAGSAYN